MFNYSSKDNEARSSSHLERVERVQGRAIGKSGIIGGLVALAFISLIAWNTVRISRLPHENTQPTSATPPTGGGDGDHGAPSPGGSGGQAGGGGSKLHPKSRLDTIADGIVTI